jgi:hypothetical protein
MRNIVLALLVGYVIGAKTAGKELDELGKSISALVGSDEFVDVVTAARSQAGSTLRELASMVDGQHRLHEVSGDLVARVKNLVASD